MPELVTTAILAAIAAGATAGITDTAKKATGDAYAGLKALLVRKLDAGSEPVEAISKLERKPASAGWKESVAEELARSEANEDQELVAAAEVVLSRLRELLPSEQRHIQQAIGSYIAQADRGSTATVNVGRD
jgi:hypothetical protein